MPWLYESISEGASEGPLAAEMLGLYVEPEPFRRLVEEAAVAPAVRQRIAQIRQLRSEFHTAWAGWLSHAASQGCGPLADS